MIKEVDRNEAEGTRQFEGDFFYATNLKDRKGMRLQTCGPEQIVKGVSDLNDYLTKEQQRWTSATFTFTGRRQVRREVRLHAVQAQAAAAPAKPAAKKKQEPAK